MDIRVVVPDAFAASDLTWNLTASAHVYQEDGRHIVEIAADGNVGQIVDQIRKWAIVSDIEPVVVHLGDTGPALDL